MIKPLEGVSMKQLLAVCILGLAFSGAALILAVPLLFHSPTGAFEWMFAAGAAGAVGVFAVSISVLRKRSF